MESGRIALVGNHSRTMQECARVLLNAGFETHHSPSIDRSSRVDLIILNTEMFQSRSMNGQDFTSIPTLVLILDPLQRRRWLRKRGVFDYILAPIVADEVIKRVTQAPKANHSVEERKNWSQSSLESRRAEQIPCRAIELLSENLAKQMSLNEIANKIGTNRTTLAKSFKLQLGMSVFTWLKQQRLRKADQLLQSTELSIQYICEEVGFKNFSHFSTEFKAHFGCSPQCKRKDLRIRKRY